MWWLREAVAWPTKEGRQRRRSEIVSSALLGGSGRSERAPDTNAKMEGMATRDTGAIPLTRPSFTDRELAAVQAAFDSGWVAGQGPRSQELEQGFCSLTGRSHAIAVNNCTAGLHLAYLAVGIGPGDEVIVGDYSFPATAHAVLYCGATPKFVDVIPGTGTLDPEQVQDAISPATRAIVGIDTLGHPAQWVDLQEIATANGVALVEDAACSAGAELNGLPAGAFGDVAVFSLHARKGITCGEGGVVVTDDDRIAELVRSRTCFGMESALSRSGAGGLPIPVFSDLGYNYKLSDILAAVACIQLERLPDLLPERAVLARRYAELLGSMSGVAIPMEAVGAKSAWQTYAVTLGESVDRAAVAGSLRASGIGCNIGTYAMHLQPVYGSSTVCPVSRSLYERQLALPFFVGMREAEQVTVADRLRAALREQGVA